MIRVVIENIVLFMLPTAIYATYVVLTRADSRQGVLEGAPLLWLVMTGAALVVVVTIAFGTTSGGVPGQNYEPPSMKDGQIEPGRIR